MKTGWNGFIAIFTIVALFASAAQAGSLSGTVRNTEGAPVEELLNVAIFAGGEDYASLDVNDGAFAFNDVPMGVYRIRVTPAGEDSWYYREFYPGVWFEDEAEWVFVPAEGEVTDIDITLRYGGRVSGAITPAEGGEFAANSVVAILLQPGEDLFDSFGSELVADPSHYASPVIPTGEYTLRVYPLPPDMHVATFYGDTHNPFEAELFVVDEQTETSGIDVTMPLGGGISGRITADGEPALCVAAGFSAGMGVYTYIFPLAYGYTDQNGDYLMRGLPVGDTYVQFIPDQEELVGQWYDGVYDPLQATSVPVTAGETATGINAALEPGAAVSGTVQMPDGSAPQPFVVDVEAVDKYGNETPLNLEWDEQGNFHSTTSLPPAFYTFVFKPIADEMLVGGYSGGRQNPWDAQWSYLGPNSVAGDIDFNLTWGGILSGVITDPDGNPASQVDVFLYQDGREQDATGVNLNGEYYFYNVPAGEYILAAAANVSAGIDEARLWPQIYSGGVFTLTEAESFQVVERDTTFVNLQLAEGGVLHVTVTNPEGGYYDLFRDNITSVPVPLLSAGGVPVFNAPTYPQEDDGPPSAGEEGISFILEPGTYTVAGVPVTADINPTMARPNIRRTFAGGGFGQEGAITADVQSGQTAELSIQMVEAGHSVSGAVATVDGEPVPAIVALADDEGLVAGVYFSFFGDGVPLRESAYEVKGVPNGNYQLMAQIDDDGFFLTTWYPDVASPGMQIEDMRPPQEAGTVNVTGSDVSGIDIIMQKVGDVTGAPTEDAAPAPTSFRLSDVRPNPFNSTASIGFILDKATKISLKLFDLQGREVASIMEGSVPAGGYSALIRGDELPAGIYLLKLEAGNQSVAKKAVLVK